MEKTFYDGPPFPSGDPHYGHLLQSAIKDMIPRWMTMNGYRVQRKRWRDCHGIPAENAVNQALGITTKQQVEEMGVAAYVDACRNMVNNVNDQWLWYIDHLGRWVDMDRAYFTMDPAFMEAVMGVFANLYQQNLIYKWFKVLGYSTGLGTSLSHSEIAEWYEDRQDPAVTIAFQLTPESITALGVDADIHAGACAFLAWTTTPWTLPSNMFLAVNPEITYVLVQDLTERTSPARFYILAKNLLDKYFKQEDEYMIVRIYSGTDLVGMTYTPLFDYYYHAPHIAKEFHTQVHRLVAADFVTDQDGTWIAHEAPAFGEDDYNLVTSILPKERAAEWLFAPVDDYGQFTADVPQRQGQNVIEANTDIIKHMKATGQCIKHETIMHSYPHCPRTWLPLIYRAVESRFLKEDHLKAKTIPCAKDVTFVPTTIHQRFINGLSSAPDWNISRTRFWWAPLPVRQNKDETARLVVGSLDEIWRYNQPHQQIVKLILRENTYESEHLATQRETKFPEETRAGTHILSAEEQTACEQNNQQHIEELMNHLTTTYPGGEVMILWSALALTHIRWYIYQPTEVQRMKYTIEALPWKSVYTTDYLYVPTWRFLDLHKPTIDEIILRHPETGQDLQRIPEVLDCWFESGSMPYAEYHRIGDTLQTQRRADVIAEGLDQTRWWFRALHVLSTALQDAPTFDHVITTGLILAADGKKMSKSKKNYSDPSGLLKQYGADAFRIYLLQAPVVRSEPLRFADTGVEQALKDVVIPLQNVWNFISTYAQVDNRKHPGTQARIMRHGNPEDQAGYLYDEEWREQIVKMQPDIIITSDIERAHTSAQAMKTIAETYTSKRPQLVVDATRWSQMSAEMSHVYEQLLQEHPGKRIVIVTHHDTIGRLRWELLGSDRAEEVGHHECIKLPLLRIENELDQWILAYLHQTIGQVEQAMKNYEIDLATKALVKIIDPLSNWYVRRSRRRFWWTWWHADKQAAYTTLFEVMEIVIQLFAPIAPFFTEAIWQEMHAFRGDGQGRWSVHHTTLPVYTPQYIHTTLLEEIETVRKIIKTALYLRATHQVKVKQPLASLWFTVE